MSNLKRAVEAVKQFNTQNQPVLNSWPAWLGNEDGNVQGSDANHVLVRYPSVNSPAVEVYNGGVPLIGNLKIRVGYRAEQPNLLQALGAADINADVLQVPVGGSVAPHGTTHTLYGGDTVWIQSQQFMPLLGWHTSPASMVIYINPGWYPYQDTGKYFAGSNTVDLTSHLPTGTGYRWTVIYIDSITNALSYADSIEYSVVDTTNIQTLLSLIPADSIPIAAVLLRKDTTYIINTRTSKMVYDLRFLITPILGADSLPEIPGGKINIGNYKIVAKSGGNYTDVQSAIDSLAGVGGVVEIMAGTYTSATINLTAEVYLVTVGNVTLQTNSGPVLLAPADSHVLISGLQLSAGGGGPAVSFPTGSTATLVLRDGRIVHNSGSYAIDASSADATAYLELRSFDIDYNTGGIHTKAQTRLINALIAGSIVQVSGAGSLTIDAGVISGSLTAVSSVTLLNLPRIDGAITGTLTGLYSTSTQLISTVATGTAPLTISSTTLNTNLNADLLDGHHDDYFQTALTTGNLGASVPLSVDNTRQVIGGAATLSIADAKADASTKGAATFNADDFNDNGNGLISLDSHYGAMYADDIAQVITVAAANTEYKVAAGLSGGTCNGFTFQNARELLCAISGTYQVQWGMSVSSGTNNENLSGGVVINTTTWQHSTEGSGNQNNSNNAVHIGGTGIITLAVNDTVGLFVENESAAHNITIRHANLSIIRVGA